MKRDESTNLKIKIGDIVKIIDENEIVLKTPDVKRIENCLNLCYLKIAKIICEVK